jgi:hypothetical protein
MYERREVRLKETADADHPTAAQLERRRQSDLEFLAWVRTATKEELRFAAETRLPRWRLAAVRRQLALR